MIRSLWIARTGLDAQQTQLDVISNNLANVSTNGFKRSRAVFEDLLYQTLRQPGAQSSQQTQIPTGLQLGTGVRPVSTAHIFTQGNLQKTDNRQISKRVRLVIWLKAIMHPTNNRYEQLKNIIAIRVNALNFRQ